MPHLQRIGVVVAHSDPLVEAGLRTTLAKHPDLQIRCTATGSSMPLTGAEPRHEVIVADYAQGMELATRLMLSTSEPVETKILIVTGSDSEWQIRSALERGVLGYLLAGCALDEFAAAIRAVSAGERYLGPEVAARLADSLSLEPLTVREEEVLRLVVDGLCNKSVGRQLGISVDTVKSRLKVAFDKLGVESRTQAAAVAARRGLWRDSGRPWSPPRVQMRASTDELAGQ